jgi:threonylcarbamoyladenosine tRNA methylthiotransferase MtaB
MPDVCSPVSRSPHLAPDGRRPAHGSPHPASDAPSFYVHNLGCKVNRVESDALSASLLAAGAHHSPRETARVVIVNTCTVTAEADAKTRKAIRQAHAAPHHPWVIATGCAIAIDRAAYEALGDRVLAEPDRNRAQAKALELLNLSRPASAPIAPPSLVPTGEGFNTRRGIKIQDGCDNACSFCIVRVARGRAHSLPPATILEQVVAAEGERVFEIVLTGVNIGSYSAVDAPLDGGGCGGAASATTDATPGAATGTLTSITASATPGAATPTLDLCHLVGRLLDATSKLRIRLSSLEPQHATDELLALMAASNGRLCAHLHLPLQSGSDHTLAAMNRLYDTAAFAQRVGRARELMPHLALTTDVIVGFPGESEQDFVQSLAFCERMAFARMHVFRYSRRPATPAAEMPHQVPPALSAARAAALRDLAAKMQQRDLAARVGTTELVLVERHNCGTSESYHRVELRGSVGGRGTANGMELLHAPHIGSLVPVHFTGYRDTLLQGTY